MKWILKPNANSSRISRSDGKTYYDAVDICHPDGSHWAAVMVDAFWDHPDVDWKRDVYDRLRLGEEVTVELTLVTP